MRRPTIVGILATLGTGLALWLCACVRERVSVGELACSGNHDVPCVENTPVDVLMDDLATVTPTMRDPVEIVWLRSTDAETFIVHDDGELTQLGASGQFGDDTWLRRLDPNGEPVSEHTLPPEPETKTEVQLIGRGLVHGPNDEALALLGYGFDQYIDGDGLIRTFTLDHSGDLSASLELSTPDLWPGSFAFLDSDPVVAITGYADDVSVARYNASGERRWLQTHVATLNPEEFGDDRLVSAQVEQLEVDARGRIWVLLTEAQVGLVQLNHDGTVAWHGRIALNSAWWPDANGRLRLMFDRHDHPIFSAGDEVWRLDPDVGDAAHRRALGSSAVQESFYEPIMSALAVDAEDRILAATQDGQRSHRLLLIDRIAATMDERERFEVPLPAEIAATGWIDWLEIGPDGDLYVQIRVPSSPEVVEPDQVLLARLRLPETP